MAVEKLIVDHIDTWTTALQTRSTAGRGSSGKIDLYGIKKLRELILELAVRGKLVPQDPNDEPASELLKRIAAEKAELVKLGKIKKPKPLPEISEEEKPFELPVGWEWIQISEIGHDWGQKTPDEDFTYIDVGSINKEFGIIEEPSILSAKDAPSRARKIVQKGTVIYSTVRPYLLNIAIIESTFSPEPIASTAFAIIHPYTAMNANFIYYYLRSPVFINYVESCQTGVAYPAINDKQFFSGIIAVPPSSEQARITKKIKELMSLCDQLEQHSLTSLDAHQQLVETLLTTLTDSQNAVELAENWARISEHFDTLFTTEASIDAFEHTILQLAVTGKLSAHYCNDTNVEETLAIIHETKKDLVKKKLYQKTSVLKPKNMELIFPPYWSHTQLGEICFSIVPNRDKPKKFSGNIPWVTLPDFPDSSLYLDTDVINLGLSPDEIEEFKSKAAPKNSILMSCIGRFGLTAISKCEVVTNQQIHIFVPIGNTSSEFLSYVIRSQKKILEENSTSTTIAYLNKSNCESIEFGLPPIEEQQRIVQKINELLNICSTLKSGIRNAQQTQLHLADALTDAAIN
ncbi:restriction endonuclease subunit S [Klebsiella michiganensis]|nr:hypothetical protein HMPREF9694_03872 [Klebsiella michiganensis]MBF8460702.1 restriction endonuclease subunit S [Klebsiella michiganensis]